MSDPRWGDVRDRDRRELDDVRGRGYDDRDRDDHDPREGLMRDLDLPRREERELVVDRDRVYELDGEDSRTLAAVGAFRVVPEHDLDINHETRPIATSQGSSGNTCDVIGTTFTLTNANVPAEPSAGSSTGHLPLHRGRSRPTRA